MISTTLQPTHSKQCTAKFRSCNREYVQHYTQFRKYILPCLHNKHNKKSKKEKKYLIFPPSLLLSFASSAYQGSAHAFSVIYTGERLLAVVRKPPQVEVGRRHPRGGGVWGGRLATEEGFSGDWLVAKGGGGTRVRGLAEV